MIHFTYKSVNPPDSATFRTDLSAAKRSRRTADRAWRKSGLSVHRQISELHDPVLSSQQVFFSSVSYMQGLFAIIITPLGN